MFYSLRDVYALVSPQMLAGHWSEVVEPRLCRLDLASDLTKLTILTAPAIDPGEHWSFVALALARDTGPDPWDGLASHQRNLVSAHLAFGGTFS